MYNYVGPFLLHWMPEVVKLAKPVDFLSLLINFVHYNATYLDEEVLVGLVQWVYAISGWSLSRLDDVIVSPQVNMQFGEQVDSNQCHHRELPNNDVMIMS